MKTKVFILAMLTMLFAACEKETDVNLGKVTVEGTFIETTNPCPRGDVCMPGMEVALQADKVYYLAGLRVEAEYYEDPSGMIEWYFICKGDTLSSTDSVRVTGELHRYPALHNKYYYRIRVSEYTVLP